MKQADKPTRMRYTAARPPEVHPGQAPWRWPCLFGPAGEDNEDIDQFLDKVAPPITPTNYSKAEWARVVILPTATCERLTSGCQSAFRSQRSPQLLRDQKYDLNVAICSQRYRRLG